MTAIETKMPDALRIDCPLRIDAPPHRLPFWEAFQALAEHEAGTDYGRAFMAAGFQLYHNGGGCHGWRKDISGDVFVLITDDEGCDHRPDGIGWLVGVHSETCEILEDSAFQQVETISAAIALSASIALPFLAQA